MSTLPAHLLPVHRCAVRVNGKVETFQFLRQAQARVDSALSQGLEVSKISMV